MSKKETIKIRQNKLKQLLLDQLKRTPTLEHACQKVGVSRMTVARWRKAGKKFDQEVEIALMEGRELVSDIAESQMFSLINQGKSEMIKYYLTHNNPRYGNKLEIKGHLSHSSEQLTKEQTKLLKEAIKLALPQNYEDKKINETENNSEDSSTDDEE